MLTPAAASILLAFAQAYLALGAALGLGFLLFGLERLAPAARGAYAFRPLLLPGLAALWPYVAWRWWRALREPAP
jgi:hypothetical protein